MCDSVRLLCLLTYYLLPRAAYGTQPPRRSYMAPEALLVDGHLTPHSFDRRPDTRLLPRAPARGNAATAWRVPPRPAHQGTPAPATHQTAAGAARPLLTEQPEEAPHRAETHRATLAGLIIAARSRAAADDGRPAARGQPAVVAGACV